MTAGVYIPCNDVDVDVAGGGTCVLTSMPGKSRSPNASSHFEKLQWWWAGLGQEFLVETGLHHSLIWKVKSRTKHSGGRNCKQKHTDQGDFLGDDIRILK